LNFNGLLIETHCNPDSAWSDAAQQITPEMLDHLLRVLTIQNAKQSSENLAELRCKLESIDNQILELLSQRLHFSDLLRSEISQKNRLAEVRP
jgi:chorismate mutase